MSIIACKFVRRVEMFKKDTTTKSANFKLERSEYTIKQSIPEFFGDFLTYLKVITLQSELDLIDMY